VANRRRARNLARLQELAQELGPDALSTVNLALLPPQQTAEPDLIQPGPIPVALRGDELAKIIKADLGDVLSRDRMYCSFFTYRRPSYSLRVILHLDNPVYLDPVKPVP
jgi:hypothetical protein